MRRQLWWVAGSCIVAAGAVGPSTGCQTRVHNPWRFAEPPARAAIDDRTPAGEPARTVVAVAEFDNPTVPQLAWAEIGAGMSEALRRALRNDTRFSVRAGAAVDRLVADSTSDGKVVLSGGDPLGVDFVITGKVTDFHHTAQLPKDVARWGFWRRRSEAVVAIEWRVIDVRTRRVIAADHTYGTADANRRMTVEETYAGLDFSAYLFWNSPLGKAGHDAVDRLVKKLRALLPAKMGDPMIVQRKGDRKVTLAGGWSWGLAEGQEYFVAIPEAGQAAPRPVYDADTGRPLKLAVGRVGKDRSKGWLLGKTALDLRGAVLSREPPPPQDLASREPLD